MALWLFGILSRSRLGKTVVLDTSLKSTGGLPGSRLGQHLLGGLKGSERKAKMSRGLEHTKTNENLPVCEDKSIPTTTKCI